MEAGLPYAYTNVGVRKHFLPKKITAPVMSAAISELLDKLEFKAFSDYQFQCHFHLDFLPCVPLSVFHKGNHHTFHNEVELGLQHMHKSHKCPKMAVPYARGIPYNFALF